MTRRHFLQSLGLGAAALALRGTTRAADVNPRRPNTLYIMSDGHADVGDRLRTGFEKPR